jgi:hypothetical protein
MDFDNLPEASMIFATSARCKETLLLNMRRSKNVVNCVGGITVNHR